MQKLDIAFNVMLSHKDKEMLDRLSDLSALPKSILIRRMLASTYLMRVEGAPYCANGHACLVPQMHAASSANRQLHPPLQSEI